MLGKRFKKGFLYTKELKWKKGHAKVKLVKKENLFINKKYLKNLYTNLMLSKKKFRKKIYRSIYKNKLYLNEKRNYLIKKQSNFIKLFYRNFGYPVLISQTYGKIADFHLENLRINLRKILGKNVIIFIRIKPYLIILKRSKLVRMGGGKGAKLNKVVYPVYPGCPLIEVRGVSYIKAMKAFKKLKFKLPIKVKLFFANCI